MGEFSFLHAADLHLDSPLRGLDPDAPAERIRSATREALVNLVEFALDRRVAFVLLAGDLYDGAQRDWRCGHFLIEQLSRLKRDGIGVFAISGNHDFDQGLIKSLPWPGTMFPASKPGTVLLPDLKVAIHGQSFGKRAILDNLALGYPASVPDHFNIGILHTACGSSAHENYAPCSLMDLRARQYDYWALGHVHVRHEVSQDPWAIFPGNLQGRHVNEPGEKGATLVHVRDGRVVSALHESLDVLRWKQIEVDVANLPDPAAVQAAVATDLAHEVATANGRLLLVRVTLRGATSAHAALQRDPAGTREGIRAAALEVAARSMLWVEDVRLRTTPALPTASQDETGAIAALLSSLLEPCSPDPVLAAMLTELVKKAGLMAEEGADLPTDHAVHELMTGVVPDDLAARARNLLLSELLGR